jgi:Mrp family chromosome partitioning ATPase
VSRYNDYPEGVEIFDVPDDTTIENRDGAHRGPTRGTLTQEGAPPTLSPFQVQPAGEVHPDRLLSIARKPDSLSAQQYRLLKYKLKEDLDPRIIGITSALPNEGKTVSAANLGLALAEGRRTRVLLLDLNLRYPQLAGLFGLPLQSTLGEQIARKRRDALAPWYVLELGSSLHLLAGKEPVESPAALLNSNEIRILMADLAQHYDYVVVDLPAILNTADVKILQDQLDGLVLVCQAGSTTRKALSASIFELGRAKILGVLLRNVPEQHIPR